MCRFVWSGDYTSIEDVGEQLVEGGHEGKMLRVKDVAEIRRDYVMPPSALLQRNGEQAIGMGISTVSGGDVIAMGHSIQERLDAIQSQIPGRHHAACDRPTRAIR